VAKWFTGLLWLKPHTFAGLFQALIDMAIFKQPGAFLTILVIVI
jgi:hypothetical protein